MGIQRHARPFEHPLEEGLLQDLSNRCSLRRKASLTEVLGIAVKIFFVMYLLTFVNLYLYQSPVLRFRSNGSNVWTSLDIPHP